MVDDTQSGMLHPNGAAAAHPAATPSRAAALGTLICIAAILAGAIGQAAAHGIVWEMVTGLGLAGLASLVLAHQR